MNDKLRKLSIMQTLNSKKHEKDVPIFIPIQKDLIDSFDIEPLYDFFQVLIDNKEFVKCYRNRIGFEYEGFGNEEMFKIESVRKFLQKLHGKFPYMFWFSVKRTPKGIDVPFLKGFLYAQCRFKTEKDLGDYIMRELDQKDVEDFLQSSELGVRELQRKHGLTDAEVMECLVDTADYLRKNVFKRFQPFDNWSHNLN